MLVIGDIPTPLVWRDSRSLPTLCGWTRISWVGLKRPFIGSTSSLGLAWTTTSVEVDSRASTSGAARRARRTRAIRRCIRLRFGSVLLRYAMRSGAGHERWSARRPDWPGVATRRQRRGRTLWGRQLRRVDRRRGLSLRREHARSCARVRVRRGSARRAARPLRATRCGRELGRGVRPCERDAELGR
jgi:hypothetical protein